MAFEYHLRHETPLDWADHALKDFDTFLLDHAACERKASAVGLSFVVRYPDRTQLIEPMIQFAREELEHFHQVYRLIQERELRLPDDNGDEYANQLLSHVRSGRDERFLDRLIVASVIEARGFERLGLIANRLEDEKLKTFYERLTRAEGHHKALFVDLATLFFPDSVIRMRLESFLDWEAQAIRRLPFRSAIH